MPTKFTVLFTHDLEAQDIEYARLHQLEPILEPALEVSFPDYWDAAFEAIAEHPRSAWVFTSQNAVAALSEMNSRGLNVRPNTQIYAVGEKTGEALEAMGLNPVYPDDYDADSLSELIIEEEAADSVLYFCGNRSRETLRQRLEEAEFQVHDVEVYHIELTTIDAPDLAYDGVSFSSPSGVEAFVNSGGASLDIPFCFAIGPATAEEVEKRLNRSAITPAKSTLRSLIDTISSTLNKEFLKSEQE